MSLEPERESRLAIALTLLLGLAGAGLGLAGASPIPATFDEVSFSCALSRYDLLAFEPHFPGYPLAVALARLAQWLGAVAPYAAAAALLNVVAVLRLQRALGGWRGAVAAGLTVLAPLATAQAGRPMADSIATALLTWGLAEAWLSSRRFAGSAIRWSGVSLLLGAAVAAKPDYVFFLSALVAALHSAPSQGRGRIATSIALGLALPALLGTLALLEGCGGFVSAANEAARFLGGHLAEWGGAVTSVTVGEPARAPRLALAAAPLCGLAGADGRPLQLGCGLLFLGLASRAPRGLRRGALAAGLPYGLWALFGQNLDHPRHLLPLLPLAAILVASGAATVLRPRFARALGLALLCGAVSGSVRDLSRVAARGRPADRLEAWFGTQDPLRARLYTGAMGRALQWRRPAWDVRRARDLAHIQDDLAVDPSPPAIVFVADGVPGGEALPLSVDLGALSVRRLGSPAPLRLVRVARPPP